MSVLDDVMATAERVVESARVRKDVAGAEAFVALDREVGVNVEKNAADVAQAHESFGIAVRTLVNSRLGFAFVTDEDDAGSAIDQAIAAARLSKRFAYSFPSPSKKPRVAGLWDSRIENLDADAVVEAGATLVDAVLGAGKDLNAAGGGVSAGTSHWAVANTEGVAVAHRNSGLSAACYVVGNRGNVSTGWAHDSSTRHDVDVASIGREAARLAVESAKPETLTGAKARDVIVRPEAAAELLATITLSSLSGRAVHRQESYYTGKKGKRVAADDFSLVDDPTIASGLGSAPTDEEGVASRAVKLIERGVLKGFLYDTATAGEYGGRTTASGVRAGGLDGRSYKAPPIVSARQVRVEAPETSFEKLVAGVDDGVLVYDLMGVHTANIVSGDFGVTSSLLFRVKNGSLEGAVSPVSISGNAHEALKRGLRLGDDAKRVDAGVGFLLPSVRFEGLSVTP